MLLLFIVAAVVQSLQNDLTEFGKVKKQGPEKKIGNKLPNMTTALMDLRNQKCKVYYDMILPKKFRSKGNAVYKLFSPKSPCATPKHQYGHKKSWRIKLTSACAMATGADHI